MFKKILAPVDFSTHTQKSLDYIKNLAPCGIDEIILLHVVDTRILNDSSMMFEETLDETELLETWTKNARIKLENLITEFSDTKIKVSVRVDSGVPFSVIINEARKPDVSLIILGHKGHNLAEELLMGSTAEKVVRKSSKAVLLTR